MKLLRLFDQSEVAGIFEDFQAGLRNTLDHFFRHGDVGDEIVSPDDDERRHFDLA